MRFRRIAKGLSIILLLCFGFLLYLDLVSIHQIYRITDAMIQSAPDEQTRQLRLAERGRRDHQELIDKAAVGSVLAIDVALVLWLAASLFRRSNPEPESAQESVYAD
jgi:hypothetical protein